MKERYLGMSESNNALRGEIETIKRINSPYMKYTYGIIVI